MVATAIGAEGVDQSFKLVVVFDEIPSATKFNQVGCVVA